MLSMATSLVNGLVDRLELESGENQQGGQLDSVSFLDSLALCPRDTWVFNLKTSGNQPWISLPFVSPGLFILADMLL